MSTQSLQLTPVQSTHAEVAPKPVISQAPTGTWKHPRFEEITRRLDASTFGDRNVKTILWSLAYLLVSVMVPAFAQKSTYTNQLLSSFGPYWDYTLHTFRLLMFLNVLYALSPLFRQKDDLSDIPLTPSQRALLGLGPSSQPATPGSQYITPPRYSRSSTPQHSSRSQSGSPYSGRESPLGVVAGGSPYSASPLFQKAVSGNVTRRLSYGTPSPLSGNMIASDSSNSLLVNTPSPSEGRRASVGLNSRWLYERGKSSPSMRAYYS